MLRQIFVFIIINELDNIFVFMMVLIQAISSFYLFIHFLWKKETKKKPSIERISTMWFSFLLSLSLSFIWFGIIQYQGNKLVHLLKCERFICYPWLVQLVC